MPACFSSPTSVITESESRPGNSRFSSAGLGAVEEPEGCYFDYLGRLGPDPAEAADRDWWRARLRDLPPPPSLPLNDAAPAPESTRLSALLSPAQAAALRGLARELPVTQTSLYLVVFAAVLARATGDRAFRLTLPGFSAPW